MRERIEAIPRSDSPADQLMILSLVCQLAAEATQDGEAEDTLRALSQRLLDLSDTLRPEAPPERHGIRGDDEGGSKG